MFSVLDVVESVINENAATIEERGIVVQTDEDLGNLTARPSHVYQVFSNIIANAIKTKWLRTFGRGACSSASGHMRNRAFQDTVNHD